MKYLTWQKNKTSKQIKNTSLTADTEIKEILSIFGEGLKNKLKQFYNSEIDAEWQKESKEECKLYKCYNEKKIYEDLFKLYEDIINQIKKINLCDVCLGEENISVQKLGLSELENMIKNYRRISAGKLTVVQKKEMVNRLLTELQKMSQKLPQICKKGCCIKQRILIQNEKAKNFDRMKRLQNDLLSLEK